MTSLDRDAAAPTGLDLLGIAGEVEDVTGDLRDARARPRAAREHSIDSVFHLAAQPIVGDANASPVPTFETNIQGTWVLLEACREAGVERVVVASSDKAYGPHERLPYTEESALQPVFPYDVSKAATDLIARSYWHTYRTAGRRDPLRQSLRRRRPELLPADPRDGHGRARRPPRR